MNRYIQILLTIYVINYLNAIPLQDKLMQYLENPTIQLFREYIQIDTSQPQNIKLAVEFWRKQAQSVGLPFQVYEPAGSPICVITLEGANKSLPSIMLNTHMDVVPVEYKEWNNPPFSGYVDFNGNIYGVGTQDTKDVSIQHFEALKTLKLNNVTLQRTLHMTLMPDEETGGESGMKQFIHTEEFKSLNIGFALDEGLASATDTILTTYVDKRPWQMSFTVIGQGGHGSTVNSGTAMEKVTRLINSVMKFRQEQQQVTASHDATDFGAFTSVNVNILKGGVVPNVIPSEINVVVDMRLAVAAEPSEMETMVKSWMEEAGSNITLKFIRKDDVSAATPIDDSNPYWVAMLEAAKEMNITLKAVVCPATSDMVVIRGLGIPAMGFAPKTRTTSRIHATDEYINAATFLRGIDVFIVLLKKLGNLS